MRLPPVSFQISQLSMVPKASLPASAFSRAPSTLSSSQASLEPEKYGSSSRPVFCCTIGSCPSRRSAAVIEAVRRSCQTMALCTGRAGLAVPEHHGLALVGDADGRDGARAPFARAARTVESVVAQITSGSCSTQPKPG
jgi:hypothetical protein